MLMRVREITSKRWLWRKTFTCERSSVTDTIQPKRGDAAYVYFVRFHRLGRAVEALELLEHSYQARLKHYGASDARTLDSLNAIGVVNNSWLHRPEVALPLFIQVRDQLLHSARPQDMAQLSSVTFNVANTQYRLKLLGESLESARESDRLSRLAFPTTDRDHYSATVVQSRTLMAMGSRAEAIALARKTLLAEVETNLPSDPGAVALSLQLLGDHLSRHNDPEVVASLGARLPIGQTSVCTYQCSVDRSPSQLLGGT